MAPAKPKDNSEAILAKLATILTKPSKFDPVLDKFKAMETLLAKLSEENTALEREVRLKDAKISGLHHHLNLLEQ